MKPGTVNKVKGSEIYGDFVGHDKITNIVMFQDKEREFVVTHNADIKPVSYFTGRETELQDLRQRIEEGRKSVLVSGMGGIGKTHICRKLFEEYTNKHANSEDIPFCHIGYIEYNGDMGSSLQNCLKYKGQDNPEQNQEASWKELEYLAADGKLLLFVDNVNVPAKEDEGLKRLKGIPGAVVLTSRRTSFSKEFKTYKIGFLDIEQCKTVYEKIRYEDSDIKVPEEEIPDLEYIIDKLAAKHTITIEFLAYLAQTKHWTVKKLRDELEEKGFQLEYKDEEDELVNIQKSYETLYDLSGLMEAEQNILEAFSVFPYIPLAAGICNEWLLTDAGAGEDDDILTGLYRKGWLQFDVEQESYSLHPVFAKFIYEKCKPKAEKHYGLVEECQKRLEIPESGSGLECQRYIPFAECIIEKIDMGKDIKQTEFTTILAYLFRYIGQYEKAKEYYKFVMKMYEEIQGFEYSDLVEIYSGLAVVHTRLGEFIKAIKLNERALEMRNRILEENNLDIARNYNDLAWLYSEIGEYEKAEKLYEKCFTIYEDVLKENHPSVATSYNNFAWLCYKQGEYRKAEELYKKSIEIIENTLGENNIDIALVYNNMTVLYQEWGKYIEAEKMNKKSIRIYERLLGKNHPDTVRCYCVLVLVHIRLKEYGKAQELLEKNIKIYEMILGENHPDIATCYSNLAWLYDNKNELGRAEELNKKSIRIREKVLGENHPDTAISYANMALVYMKQGRYRESEKLNEKSLKIYKKVLGENHITTATCYNNLALLYIFQGNSVKSLNYFCKAYKVMVSKLELGDPRIQVVFENMNMLYNELNQGGNFKQWLEEKMKETK